MFVKLVVLLTLLVLPSGGYIVNREHSPHIPGNSTHTSEPTADTTEPITTPELTTSSEPTTTPEPTTSSEPTTTPEPTTSSEPTTPEPTTPEPTTPEPSTPEPPTTLEPTTEPTTSEPRTTPEPTTEPVSSFICGGVPTTSPTTTPDGSSTWHHHSHTPHVVTSSPTEDYNTGHQRTCPPSHPNVYYNGEYCCENNHEKVYKPQGEQCDGGTIAFTSLCCKDDAYTECTEPPCSNFLPTGGVPSTEPTEPTPPTSSWRHPHVTTSSPTYNTGHQQTCPPSHPNVYYNGKYCCANNQEKVYKPQGEQCDGGTIGFTSLCCKDDAYTECTEPPCSNFLPTDYTTEEDWHVFSLSNRIDLALQWKDSEETYYVKFPCSDSIWFKLFLNGAGHQNSHIELFSKSSGNIYCNRAGSRSWYDGERTDFYIDNEWQCEDDGEYMILEVEKTREHVTLKNRGSTLYSQSFGRYDGNCAEPTVSVTTQVWNYDGQLSLAFNFRDTELETEPETELISARDNEPVIFDATSCTLKVISAGETPGSRRGPYSSPDSWNGDVAFHADGEELLLIGLHPERGNLAIRNDVFKRGSLMWSYHWVNTHYRVYNLYKGEREYIFEFAQNGLVLTSEGGTLITIPYEELTYDKDQFLKSINTVNFVLGTTNNRVVMQYSKICKGSPTDPTATEQSGVVTEPTAVTEVVTDPARTVSDQYITESHIIPNKCGDDFECEERCIPTTWVCDGSEDCWLGEDEQNCPGCKDEKCVVRSNDIVFATGKKMTSENKEMYLIMERNGNLVLYCDDGKMIWESGTSGTSNAKGLILQANGNMALYNDKTKEIVWETGTGYSSDGFELVVQNDNNLVLYHGENPRWASDTTNQCKKAPKTGLCSGDRCRVVTGGRDVILGPGESIRANNGETALYMQVDGNLVLYCKGGVPIWHSNTWDNGNMNTTQLVLKTTGEMIVERKTGTERWRSNTAGNEKGITLVVQEDNNLVLYTLKGVPIWQSNTWNRC